MFDRCDDSKPVPSKSPAEWEVATDHQPRYVPRVKDRVSDPGIAEDFATIARAFDAEPTPEATLTRITQTAVRAVTGCEHATLSVRQVGKIETQAPTGEPARRADALQYQLDEGPCLDAIRKVESCLVSDLLADSRWPEFCARATTVTGLRGVLSLRLFVQDEVLGALNLYAAQPDAFDDSSHAVGAILAAHAAVAIRAARARAEAEHLQIALKTNRRIAMALGILMAHGRRTESEAWDLLRLSSSRLNIKLRELAAHVIEIGEFDERRILHSRARATAQTSTTRASNGVRPPLVLRTGEDAALTVIGYIDLSNLAAWSLALAKLLAPRGTAVIDLTEASFISAEGMTVLVNAARRLPAGQRLVLLNPNGMLTRALGLLWPEDVGTGLQIVRKP